MKRCRFSCACFDLECDMSCDERPHGDYVKFTDVQQLARELIDPLNVAMVQAAIEGDNEYLDKARGLLDRLKSIAGAA